LVLLCFPTRDYFGQEFKKDAEVKAFALERVPEGLTILKTAGLGARPGWVFPKPSWNFGGKWLISSRGIMETANPEEDVEKLLAGMEESEIEAAGNAVERVVKAVKTLDEAAFLELWPGDSDSGIAMFKELDVNGDGVVSHEEAQKVLETQKS